MLAARCSTEPETDQVSICSDSTNLNQYKGRWTKSHETLRTASKKPQIHGEQEIIFSVPIDLSGLNAAERTRGDRIVALRQIEVDDGTGDLDVF